MLFLCPLCAQVCPRPSWHQWCSRSAYSFPLCHALLLQPINPPQPSRLRMTPYGTWSPDWSLLYLPFSDKLCCPHIFTSTHTFFLFKIFFILFLAVLDLRGCERALSSCRQQELFSSSELWWLWIVVASPSGEHRPQARGLSSGGVRAWLFHGLWDLPWRGMEAMSPALQGRFSTPGSARKPSTYSLTQGRPVSPPTLPLTAAGKVTVTLSVYMCVCVYKVDWTQCL